LLQTSCGNTATNGNSSSTDEFGIYDLNENQTGLVKEPYKLKNKSDVYSEVGELIKAMKGTSTDGSMSRPIPEDLECQDYSYDKKNDEIILSFSRTYSTLSPVKETLIRSAVSMTLLQIKEIKKVTFEVEHEPIKSLKNDGSLLSTMKEDSFVQSLAGKDANRQKTSLTLYYPDKKGQGLYGISKKVEYSSNTSLERVVMKYLSQIPSDKNAVPAYPSTVSILNIYVADGTCYVNMDSSFLDNVSDQELELRVYSIVNSLASLERVKRVQLSCNGENLSLKNDTDNNGPLYSKNESIIISDSSDE
jgi:germination protein M